MDKIARNELILEICERIAGNIFPEVANYTKMIWQLRIGPIDEIHYSDGLVELIDKDGKWVSSHELMDFPKDNPEVNKIHDLLVGVRGSLSDSEFNEGNLCYPELENILKTHIETSRGSVCLNQDELKRSTMLFKYVFKDIATMSTIYREATKNQIEMMEFRVYENWENPREILKIDIDDYLSKRDDGMYAIWMRYPGPEIFFYKQELGEPPARPPARLENLLNTILKSGHKEFVLLENLYKSLWPQDSNPSLRVTVPEIKHQIQKELSACRKYFGNCLRASWPNSPLPHLVMTKDFNYCIIEPINFSN